MKDDLDTGAEKTWCPGCGNFGIMNAFRAAIGKLETKGVGRDRVVMSAGIGNHAKIFDYVNLSGVYSLHGRSMATIQGMKLANPDLKVVGFAGDGDALGEGIAHLIFAAKRNSDVTVVVHENGIYALTTGQRAPTSPRGYRGPSTPGGSVENPLNPLVLMLESGATFVARGYSGHVDQLADLMVAAIEHEGFSFVDVLQPCVIFNNRYEQLNEIVEPIDGPPMEFDEALAAARVEEPLRTGIFYRAERPSHEGALLGGRNPFKDHPTREARLTAVDDLLAKH